MGQRATYRAPGHRVARHFRALGSAALAAALLGMPFVAVAPAAADSSNQWPLEYLKATQDWAISKGSGTTVAVVDTGVAKIPDTQAALLSGADFSRGTSSSGNGQTDLYGHGTAIAVLIAGAGNPVDGLAPAAKVLPVRYSTGDGAYADYMAAGIEYAISRHVSVINISQGVSSTDAALAKAVQDAEAANIVIVAASGNESQSAVDIPANLSGVIAVGATDQSGRIWSDSNSGLQVTLSAPGVRIQTEDETGGLSTSDGTSIATAYVSATVALIRSVHPSWTAGQVIRDLIATADPGPGQVAGAHSDQYGYGIVDPLKALQASAPTDTSNPLLASSSAAPTGSAASTPASNSAHSKSSGSALVGGIIILVVLGSAVLLIVWLVRRNRNRPGGPGGQPPYGGSPGGPGQGYAIPPQQQNPYQQSPYPQAPTPYPAPQQYPPQPPHYPAQPPQQPPPQEQNPYGYR